MPHRKRIPHNDYNLYMPHSEYNGYMPYRPCISSSECNQYMTKRCVPAVYNSLSMLNRGLSQYPFAETMIF